MVTVGSPAIYSRLPLYLALFPAIRTTLRNFNPLAFVESFVEFRKLKGVTAILTGNVSNAVLPLPAREAMRWKLQALVGEILLLVRADLERISADLAVLLDGV
jgi:hypothetical protein